MSTRRLFCDPGSKSSGWALFSGNVLVMSGTCKSDSKDVGDNDAFRRLALIMGQYGTLSQEVVDEVHIEQLVTRTHQYTHWSVGAIGALLSSMLKGQNGRPPTVTADVPIKSWQRYVGWRKKKSAATEIDDVTVSHLQLKRLQKSKDVGSLDELAAIGLGLYWVNEGCNMKKVAG